MSFFMLPSLTDTSSSNIFNSFMMAQCAKSMALQSIWLNNMFTNSFCYPMQMNMPCFNFTQVPYPTNMNQTPGAYNFNYWEQYYNPTTPTTTTTTTPSSKANKNTDSETEEKVDVEIKNEDTPEERLEKEQLKATADFVEKLSQSSKLNKEDKTKLEYALDNYTNKETVAEMNECLTEAISEIPEDAIKDIIASPNSDIVTIDNKPIGEYLREIGTFGSESSENKSLKDHVNTTKEVLMNLTRIDALANGQLLGRINLERNIESNILNVISIWNTGRAPNGNGGLIESLYKKYQSTELDKPKEFWNNAIVPYIDMLADKADEISQNVKDNKIKNNINIAKSNLLNCKDVGSTNLVKAFNELYVILRRAAAQVADEKLKDEYGYLETENSNFKTDVYSKMTNEVLKKECFDDNYASRITANHEAVLNPKYVDVVVAACKNSETINEDTKTTEQCKYIKTYRFNLSSNNTSFAENSNIVNTLKELKKVAVKEGNIPENISNQRYKYALDYLNNALKAAVNYNRPKNGNAVDFTYTVSNRHTSKVVCSQENTTNKEELDNIARQYISGKDSNGISIAFAKAKDATGKRQASIAINWAEIYHRFFQSSRCVYCY